METKRIFDNRALKRLIIPLVIEQMLAMAVGMIDTAMISSAGEAAVSGVSLVDMINALLLYLFASLGTGGAVVTAQFIGGRSVQEARSSARQLLLLALGASAAVVGVLMLTRRALLAVTFGSVEADVMEAANVYFFWSILSYPFMALYGAGAALFRATGNSKISMYSALVMNLLNVAGNALTLYVLHWGVAGVAIATLVSRAVAMVTVLRMLADKRNVIYVDFRERFRFHWPTMRRILRIAVPNSVENSMFHLGRLLVVRVIADFGTVEIAANAVANSLAGVGIIPGNALCLAMVTVAGQCAGAGDYEQVRYYTKKLLAIAYGLLLVTNTALLAGLKWILLLYKLSGPTMELASLLSWIHGVCAILLWATAFVLPNTLRASDDVRFTMVVSLGSMAVFRVLLSMFLAHRYGLGALGVWCAMIVDWIVRCIIFVLRYRGDRWQKHRVSLL